MWYYPLLQDSICKNSIFCGRSNTAIKGCSIQLNISAYCNIVTIRAEDGRYVEDTGCQDLDRYSEISDLDGLSECSEISEHWRYASILVF